MKFVACDYEAGGDRDRLAMDVVSGKSVETAGETWAATTTTTTTTTATTTSTVTASRGILMADHQHRHTWGTKPSSSSGHEFGWTTPRAPDGDAATAGITQHHAMWDGAYQAPLVADYRRQGWKRSYGAMDVGGGSNGAMSIVEPAQALGLKPSRARMAGCSDQWLPAGSFGREWYEPMAGRGAGSSWLSPDHFQGWKRNCITATTTMNTGIQSPRWGTDHQQRHYHFDSRPCSEGKLDAEMTMFESQLTRAVSGHFSSLSSVSPSLENSKDAPNVVADDAVSSKSSELVTSVLKRKRSELPDGDIEGECGWTQPLKPLIRKGLTNSDVGELGRIIVPKNDAESQSFPQIDTKEGTVLEMEDYTTFKRWYFRFKYWINNKSRMYVLENTGEFIKYHSLKEHDIFIVYEDGCKKLVVCGQKKKSSDNLDAVLEVSKGPMAESSTSEPTTTTTEGELSSRNDHHLHHQHP